MKSNNPERVKRVEGPNKSWYLYIAQASTNRFYVGITTNPVKRIIKHNLGKGSRFAIQ